MDKPNIHKDEIAQRLKTARELSGLSQGQVANMLGIHRPSVSAIEAGTRKVSAEEIKEFARIYDVSTSWLLGEEADENLAKIEWAARELSKLKQEDMDKLLDLLKIIRTS